MGDSANQLQRTLDADLGTITSTGDALGAQVKTAETTATGVGGLAGELGLDGESAVAAEGRLGQVATRIQSVMADLEQLQAASVAAHDALSRAQDAFHQLPDASLSPLERAGLAATAVAGPIGLAGGAAGAAVLLGRKEAARESEADRALAALSNDLDSIAVTPAGRDSGFEALDTTSHDPATGGSTPGGTGVRSFGTNGTGSLGGTPVPGWTPGTGSTGGTSTVAPTWTAPEVGGGLGTGSGGSAGSGATIGGGVGSVIGGSGSGIGGGHVPGTGDGTSSDGLVGGTVPGGSGSGAGGSYGSGGGSGSNGSGSGLGLSAGGLAGGLTVGGAALGGAGLNRLAGGGAGGLGGGGLGGVGGAGGSMSLGALGATSSGAGTSGSGLSGSASGLAQGTQTGAPGAAASGTRAGSMMGGPMGGGGGGGASSSSKRRGSSGLLAPDIQVEDGADAPDLGNAARAGGRDSLRAVPPTAGAASDDEW